jgi:hypothetical protein
MVDRNRGTLETFADALSSDLAQALHDKYNREVLTAKQQARPRMTEQDAGNEQEQAF